MAFAVDCVLHGYELRGASKDSSKKGVPFVKLRLEAPNGNTCEPYTSEQNLFPGLLAMRKGTVADWPVAAIAGQKASYIKLLGEPREPDGRWTDLQAGA